MKKISLALGIVLLAAAFTTRPIVEDPIKKIIKSDADNGGIKLATGFGAVVVAEETGKARHIAVLPNGTIYIKNSNAKENKGITMLRDTDGDGKADIKEYFGNYVGTGMRFIMVIYTLHQIRKYFVIN